MLASSVEYVHVKLTTPQDVSADPVEISFDGGSTWHAAQHETGGVRILVGPDQLLLPTGLLRVLVRITDSPEVPVLDAGRLNVD